METQEQHKQAIEKTRSTREVGFPVDIFENENEILLVADLPGVDAKQIGIHVDLPEFRIEAKAEGSEPVSYRRAFRVDERIDPERVNAEYKSGVLEVHLAKSAAFRPRRIEVRAS
ncbi:MAG TPA: Hsp20/alpha crystallin family protein [Polyangiaceae bacterium]|jgi:HSP20 family molecular chaperone IbpA